MDNGEITVVDRKKAIIITAGGKNIAPSEIENALKDSEFIKEAIVVGEARKYLGAIIQVDFDTVGRWARDKALAYTNYKSLAQLAEVHALVDALLRPPTSGSRGSRTSAASPSWKRNSITTMAS